MRNKFGEIAQMDAMYNYSFQNTVSKEMVAYNQTSNQNEQI